MPTWVYEQEGLLEEIIEVVMAESLVGNGYPYPIEVADSVAAIRHSEKEIFYNHLQKYLPVNLQKSSKNISKSNRRISQISF